MAGKVGRRIKKFVRRAAAVGTFGGSLLFDKKTRKDVGRVLKKVGGHVDHKAAPFEFSPSAGGGGGLPIYGSGEQPNLEKAQRFFGNQTGFINKLGGAVANTLAEKQPAAFTAPTPQSIWASAPAQQQQQIDMLRRQAMGMGGPSAAQVQQQIGMENAQRRMLAMAGGARGNQALAQRQALSAGQQMMLEGNQQAALMRAQEQLGAQQQLGGALQGLGAQGLQAAQLQQHGQLSEEEMRLREHLARQNIKAGIAQQNAQVVPGLIQGVGQMGATAAMMSDRRAKKKIASKPKSVKELLEKLSPKTFEYKRPEHGPRGLHLGIMAQDLEKSRIGGEMVAKGPDGLRRVDTQKLLSATIASAAHLHRRLKKLEGKAA